MHTDDADITCAGSCSLQPACGKRTLRMFSKPSKATVMMRASAQVSRSHRGLMQPALTKYLICSCVPPEVALLMAQAASLRMSNSALASRCASGWTRLASMTCVYTLALALYWSHTSRQAEEHLQLTT